MVNCKDGELRQVFINLISNALDATQRGGRLVVRMRVSRQLMGKGRAAKWVHGVKMSFADTGTGMPRVVQQRIFEPFFTTKGDTGNGLGLWVAKDLIEKYGGVMRVWSSMIPGRTGTVFQVFLPLMQDGDA